MYSLYGGYGQGGFSSRQQQREPDYMDVTFPYFNLEHFQKSTQSDSQTANGVNRDQQYEQLVMQSKQEDQQIASGESADAKDPQYVEEAPLFYSNARNLVDRQQGYATSVREIEEMEQTYNYRQCIDCKVTGLIFVCLQCLDSFCDVCYAANHRKGNRLVHNRISADLYLTAKKSGQDPSTLVSQPPPLIDPDDLSSDRSTSKHSTSTADDPAAMDSSLTSHQEGAVGSSDGSMTKSQSDSNYGFLGGILSIFSPKSTSTPEKRPLQPVIPPQTAHTSSSTLLSTASSSSLLSTPIPQTPAIPVDDPSLLGGWWKDTPAGFLRGRSRFIPLRLNHQERYHLRLLTSILMSSNYIALVDRALPPAKRLLTMTQSCLSVITALLAAKSFTIASVGDIPRYKQYIESMFELGVRHYLRLQSTAPWYNILVCILQDLQHPDVQKIIGCRFDIRVKTVHSLMKQHGCLSLLDTSAFYSATEPICVDVKSDLAKVISKRKNDALSHLINTYGKNPRYSISAETLRLCIMSVGDHNYNLHYSRDICTRIARLVCGVFQWDHRPFVGVDHCADNAMITASDDATTSDVAKNIRVSLDVIQDRSEEQYELPRDDFLRLLAPNAPLDRVLQVYPDALSKSSSTKSYNNDLDSMVLECLNESNDKYLAVDRVDLIDQSMPLHRSHVQHLHHVLQTINLWETITHYLPFLMMISFESVLDVDSNPYKLCDNGQGYVRIQPAVLLQRVLTSLVVSVLNGVGSFAVHVGDSAVPNAITLVDKYLQLNPMLSPLLSTTRFWWRNTVFNEVQTSRYTYTLTTHCATSMKVGHRRMLHHWTKNSMNGTGGDNVYESGSCVDGRMTSLNEWINQLHAQPFYYLFLLAGFTSFNVVQWD